MRLGASLDSSSYFIGSMRNFRIYTGDFPAWNQISSCSLSVGSLQFYDSKQNLSSDFDCLQCPESYIEIYSPCNNNGTCEMTCLPICDISCATCNGPSPNNCTTCIPGLLYNSGQCVSNCSDGQLQINNTCVPCPQCLTQNQLHFAQQVGTLSGLTTMAALLPTMVANPTLFWSSVRSFQFSYYIILLNIDLPNNVVQMLNGFKFTRLSFLPNLFEEWAGSVMPVMPSGKFFQNGYSALFLVNSGRMMFILVVAIGISLTAIFIGAVVHILAPRYDAKWFAVKKSICWGFVIWVGLYGFLEICVSIFLQYNYLSFTDFFSYQSFIFSLIVPSVWICVLMFMVKQLNNKRLITNENFKDQFGAFFLGFKQETLTQRCFEIVDCIRKAFFSLWLVVLYIAPVAQILLILLGDIAYVIMLFKHKPYLNKSENILKSAGEVINCLIDLFLFVIAIRQASPYDSGSIGLGWAIIVSLITTLVMNLLFMVVNQFYTIKDILKEHFGKKSYKATRRLRILSKHREKGIMLANRQKDI